MNLLLLKRLLNRRKIMFIPPVGYELILYIIGDGSIVINQVTYTQYQSPHTLLNLSGVILMNVEYGEESWEYNWLGIDRADVTGTYPNHAINVNADKQIYCIFSGGD